jgi:hypothetical protein
MVIVALVFTVFPKLIQVSSKITTNTLKEEAMYSSIALISLIKSLPWDDKNVDLNDILIVKDGDSNYDCNYSFANSNTIYRKGSFVGSRNCINKTESSAIGLEETSIDEADDIDDFNGTGVTMENYNASREYNATVSVYYMEDFPIDGERNGSIVKKDNYRSNVKYIEVKIETNSKRAKVLGDNFAKFWYISSNIGLLRVYSEPWSK